MFASFLFVVIGLVLLGISLFGAASNATIYLAIAGISFLLAFVTRFVVAKLDPEGTERHREEVKDFFSRGILDCDLPQDPNHDNAPAFFRFIGKLRPFYDFLYKIILFICKLLLIADIIITTWSVLGRYIPNITDPHWSEEMVLTFMVYMAVLSATLAIRKRTHIRMTAFDKYLSKNLIAVLDLLADFAVMALGVVLVIKGREVIDPNGSLAKFAKYSSIPNLSQTWQFLPMVVAGVGMVLFELEQVFMRIEELCTRNKPDGKEAQA